MVPKILIIKPSGIGDIVHSLPVAIALKKINPDCRLHWLIFSKFEQLLKNVNYIDKVIQWDRKGGLREYMRVIKLIRSENYDMVIDLQSLLRTAILSFFSGAKEKITVGLTREFSWLFEKPVSKFNPELHAVERNYEIIKYLGGQNLPSPDDLLPWLKITNDEKKITNSAMVGFENNKNLVLFSVGSRGAHKIWPQTHYAKLINLMNERYDITPVFLGSKEESALIEKTTGEINCKSINLAGKTDLRTTLAVIDECCLVIGNDNGIVHMAAALDKPVLVIFGATNPKWYYPYNKKSKYIYKNYPCSPCGIKTFCRDYKCMKDIKPEEVFNFLRDNFENYLK